MADKGKRPETFDIHKLLGGWEGVEGVELGDMAEFLQLIMNLESRAYATPQNPSGDVYQQLKDGSEGTGAGLFQLERHAGAGGMTRLTRAVDKLPKELTPGALYRHYEKYSDWKHRGTKDAVNMGAYDVKAKLHPHQQKYLMASNIMLPSGGRGMYDK
mgnify:CR=1 FL=1